MDMSSSSSPLQLQGSSPFLFDCEDLLKQTYDPSSDSGYFSCCSSLSPTSSVDSFCFSPAPLPGVNRQDPLDCFVFSSAAAQVKEEARTLPVQGTGTRQSRSRYPGKKRQTASEREKLRMRDLTKALHHLRGYLPPSVVPAGQTLTKIETLRLTMRYISSLSAQLGLSEEGLSQRSPGAVDQTQTQHQNIIAAHYSPQEPCYNAMEEVDKTIPYQQSPPAHHFSSLPDSYQIPSDMCYAPSAAQHYWMPQQQQYMFSGHC